MHQPKVYQRDDGDWTFSFEGQESLMFFSPCDFPDMVQVGGVYLSKEDLRLPNATFPEGSYGVYRCIQRIINGRAREVTWYHRGKVDKLPLSPELEELRAEVARLDQEAGGDELTDEHVALRQKLKEASRYAYHFDDHECEHCYATEAEATAALGMHAFLNRGAVGRLDEVKQQFDMQHTARTEVVHGQDTTGAVHEITIEVPAKKAVDAIVRDGRIVIVDDAGGEHLCWAQVSEVRPPDEQPWKPPMTCNFKQITIPAAEAAAKSARWAAQTPPAISAADQSSA